MWDLSRNPAYKNYGAAGYGGDCTNFISQCLADGNRTMIQGGNRDPDIWYCNNIESRYGKETKFYYYHIDDNLPDLSPGARIQRNWHSL
jgi:hypothetical protein